MSTNLPTSELDFDGIKRSLKAYLKDHPKFRDYNFEGSVLSTLVDVLAYNTHYNAMYDHMAINESFLDSAVRRSSIVSRAKEAGYTPASARAATALINVTISNVTIGEASTFRTIARGTRFRGLIDGVANSAAMFVVSEPAVAYLRNGSYTWEGLQIKEGELVEYTFDVTEDNKLQPFTLPHENIDTTTIRVRVQPNRSSTELHAFTHAEDVYDIDGTSKVFWVQEGLVGDSKPFWNMETVAGLPEIYFGDGVIGQALEPGSRILVDYIKTNKAVANGIRRFTAMDNVALFPNQRAIITTIAPASGGSDPESASSIKRNAPMHRAARMRAVTEQDYKTHIQNKFPFVEAVAVWGGERADPPVYGKVFISMKPVGGYFISESTKQHIIGSFLSERNVVTIQPTFVDPTYLFVGATVNIRRDPSRSIASAASVVTIVTAALKQWFKNSFNRFDRTLIHADMINVIKQADPSIVSVEARPRIQHRIRYTAGRSQVIERTLANKVRYDSVASEIFTTVIGKQSVQVTIKDKPAVAGERAYRSKGKLILVRVADAREVAEIGEIDYNTGAYILRQLLITSSYDNELRLSAEIRGADVFSRHNTIITFDDTPVGSVGTFPSGIGISVVDEG